MNATATIMRTARKIELLQVLINHPRTGAEERDAAQRMLARVVAKAHANGETPTETTAGPVGYRYPEVSYGAKYEQVKHLSTTEIAKLIRADIKLARKVETKLGTAAGADIAIVDGLAALASMPKTIKVSVRSEYFSGGSSIDVRVYNLPEKGWGYVHEEYPRPHWTPGAELSAILDALAEIHRAYNYNGSDAMVDYFDVNYYGHVDVDWRDRP